MKMNYGKKMDKMDKMDKMPKGKGKDAEPKGKGKAKDADPKAKDMMGKMKMLMKAKKKK